MNNEDDERSDSAMPKALTLDGHSLVALRNEQGNALNA
jgi:hypothetical protein